MHRLRSSLVLVVLVVALTPLGRAEAGGPTSVLLTVPGDGATASLYYTDPQYEALARVVGMEADDGVGKVDRSGLDHAKGPGIRVTWLIHDVTPWRVDHIYLEGEGAPWISTQTTNGGGSIWDAPVVWHRPDSPAGLAALLDDLGLAEASLTAGPFTGVPGADAPPPAGQAQNAASGTATASGLAGGSDRAVWWGLAGLLVGALATWLLMGVPRPGRERAVFASARRP
ncbi:hypothetical protein [Nocardioides sp.]|uniref:hypothetical protein n=1 Tax=Nocardioides sp. TaxID=35761 RepID=UPI002ED2B40A